MRKIVPIILVIFLSMAGEDLAQSPPNAENTAPSMSAAVKAWPLFYRTLRTAVWKRDRVALRRLMASDFSCDQDEVIVWVDSNHDGDLRDEAFQAWDRRLKWNNQTFWAELKVILAEVSEPYTFNDLIQRTVHKRGTQVGFSADFEFRVDGHWYFMGMSTYFED